MYLLTGGDTTPTTAGHALLIPFACTLKAFTVAWGDLSAISIGGGEDFTFTVGEMAPNVTTTAANYTPYVPSQVMWTNADDAT